MRTRLYICGPMTGIAEYNQPAFDKAATSLRRVGYKVQNPADLGLRDETPWEQAMKEALRVMLKCDGIALLPHWGNSRGARLEVTIAEQLGIPHQTVHRWIAQDTGGE